MVSNTTTINGSKLMLHCGGALATLDEVRAVETPDPYDQTFPIPHAVVRDTVVDGLEDLGWTVQEEAHGLMGDGLRWFGLIGIQQPGVEDEESMWTLSCRNSHDHAFAAQGYLSRYTFLCDNLQHTVTGEVMRFARKKTRYIARDFRGVVFDGLGKLQGQMAAAEERFEAYRDYRFADDAQVREFLFRSAETRAVPWQRLPKVWNEWQREDGCGGHGYANPLDFGNASAMRMVNCFTEIEKEHPSMLEGPRRNSRLLALLDAQAGVATGPVMLEA